VDLALSGELGLASLLGGDLIETRRPQRRVTRTVGLGGLRLLRRLLCALLHLTCLGLLGVELLLVGRTGVLLVGSVALVRVLRLGLVARIALRRGLLRCGVALLGSGRSLLRLGLLRIGRDLCLFLLLSRGLARLLGLW
jgi:hypothetical protein